MGCLKKTGILKSVAKLVAEALFEPVGAKAGRKLPCQLAEEERGLELEKLMYKHICNSVKTWTPMSGHLQVLQFFGGFSLRKKRKG